jgi:hypothetical protein
MVHNAEVITCHIVFLTKFNVHKNFHFLFLPLNVTFSLLWICLHASSLLRIVLNNSVNNENIWHTYSCVKKNNKNLICVSILIKHKRFIVLSDKTVCVFIWDVGAKVRLIICKYQPFLYTLIKCCYDYRSNCDIAEHACKEMLRVYRTWTAKIKLCKNYF